MFRLTCIREREQGAIAMIVAMLFGFGVMIGLAALTVDVGNINADRRQLQNGADAVALAVAQQCAATGTCDPTATNLGDLANANAADKATAIKRVDNQKPLDPTTLTPVTDPAYPAICGDATGLKKCNPAWTQSMSNLQECPSTPSSGKYVRVYAETKNSAGDNILPYYFGAALTGISDANQQACATVAWGTLSKATVFPFAFSACEWSVATTGQTVDPPPVAPTYPPGPPYGAANPAQASWQKAIVLNDNTAITDCADWQGHDLPGGFGWVDTPSCNVTLSAGDWIGIDQGMGKGNNCATDITQSLHKIINIPVYDCMDDSRKRSSPCVGESVNPSSAFYHIKGFASFYMTGIVVTGQIDIPPDFPPSTTKDPTPSEACAGKCIYGWFLRDLIPVGGDLDGSQDFGTTFIKLVG